jgi:O-antigen ligase
MRLGLLVPPIAFLLASSIVPLEATLRALFCGADETLICRPSMRLPLWLSSLELIWAHPLFGLGIKHRMGEGWMNNPQNAVLALGVYFGLPFLLLAVVALALLLRRLASAQPGLMVHWAAAMMAFSSVYFAFEPSPHAFYNAHWLFFWLPVAVILMAERRRASAPRAA